MLQWSGSLSYKLKQAPILLQCMLIGVQYAQL